MSSGTIKIAEHKGVFVIKMEGDVRLTLCLSFDDYLEQILQRDDFDTVVFDLTQAQAIDSTTLGLMAKVSIKSTQHGFELPLVISNNPSITRILVSMGFDDIFRIVDNDSFLAGKKMEAVSVSIQSKDGSETEVRNTVLEAHRYLMSLNEENRATFKELVETLEASK